MAELTVIIPTYNRVNLLKEVLKTLNRQLYDLNKVEVLVLDDFSAANPKQEIMKLKLKYKLRFYRMKKHLGQGMVRNKGIGLAHGRYLMFIGDDIFPKNNLLYEHMRIHNKNSKIAVLGKVCWEKKLRNKFMNFIENIQFHYQTIKNKNDVKLHFYTSNISLEKSWFKLERFSPKFKNYGLEDLELGYRLEKRGLRVVYNSSAIVYHHHLYDFDKFCQRMRNTGKSATIFARLHPELERRYLPYGRGIIKIGSCIFSWSFFKHVNLGLYWYSNFVRSYLEGIEEGVKDLKSVGNIF